MPNEEILCSELQTTSFIIDSDLKAEWAIKKINFLNSIENEDTRLISVCDAAIEHYKKLKEKHENKRNDECSYFVGLLIQYFETVSPKVSKTQASYKLPSGKLVKKFARKELKYDEDKLIEMLKDTDYVELAPKLKWGDYKKTLHIEDDNVIGSDGKIIKDGIKIEIKPASFDVQF